MMYNDSSVVRIKDVIQEKQRYYPHDDEVQDVNDIVDEFSDETEEETHKETHQETILKYASAIKKDSRRWRSDAINKFLDRIENELIVLCQKRYTNEEIVKILNRALKDDTFRKKYQVPDFIRRLTEDRLRGKLREIRKKKTERYDR